jgi:hypothetical protein
MFRDSVSIFLLVSMLLGTSCKVFEQGAEPYDTAWESVVDSEGWEANLKPVPETGGGEVHYAIPSYSPFEPGVADPQFLKRYPALVSRAYFRLIAEAQQADKRIAKSYQDTYRRAKAPSGENNQILQREFEMAEKRFQAHREMLEGLRSWNAFNDYGSDDLDFFMQEQLPVAYEKHERGVREDELVDYLMRGLADLYHKTYGGLPPDELLQG